MIKKHKQFVLYICTYWKAMKRIKFVLLGLVSAGVIGYACKKEPIDSKLFVERYLVGTAKWPIQSYVRLTLKNNDTLVKDTAALDTVIFNSDLKFIKGDTAVGFTIDDTGKNITFNTQPDSTWQITYLRTASFKLIHERKETVGSDVMTYKIEQVLKK